MTIDNGAIGKNEELSHLIKEIITHNQTSLQRLYLRNNDFEENPLFFQLIADAFKQNTNIKELNLAESYLGHSSEIFKQLAQIISNDAIKFLNLKNNGIALDHKNMQNLCLGLKNSKLEKLNLEKNQLGSDAGVIKTLTDALGENKCLKELNLRDNCLGNHYLCFKYLADFIKSNGSLKKLDLSFNSLEQSSSPEILKPLIEALKVNKSLEELILENMNLASKNSDDIKFLAEGLVYNKSIKKLSLKNCLSIGRSNDALYSLNQILKENESIQFLDLEYIGLGESSNGLHYLNEGIKENKTISELNLKYNFLNDKNGLKFLEEGFSRNKGIKKLNLDYCSSRNSEFYASLAAIIKINSSILELSLENKMDEPESMKLLSEGLKSNRTLRKLNLNKNNLFGNMEKTKHLINALTINDSLQILSLEEQLSDPFENKIAINLSAVKLFSGFLKNNRSVKELNLNKNDFGSNPKYSVIYESLATNNGIETLFLNENNFGKNLETTKGVSLLLEINKSIKILHLNDNSIRNDDDKNNHYKVFFDGLKKNSTLQELALGANGLGFEIECIRNLVDSLKINKSLNKLILSPGNNLRDYECLKVLFQGLGQSQNLYEVDLEKVGVPFNYAQAVQGHIKKGMRVIFRENIRYQD